MNRLYREFSSMVKSCNPDLKIISSPATKYYPGREEEFLEFWDMVLTDANLDVFMPQDSIGTLCCPLARRREMWKLRRQLADRHQVAFSMGKAVHNPLNLSARTIDIPSSRSILR